MSGERWYAKRVSVLERSVRIQEHIAIRPEGGPTIAYLPCGKDSRVDIQEANARLMVAAPELLGALRALMARDLRWVKRELVALS